MTREEAIAVVRKNYPHVSESDTQFETALRTLVPELAEDKDEWIRKKLITFFRRFPYTNLYNEDLNAKDVLSWLEKQGEQKSQRIISAEAKEDLFNYTNILSAEENTTLENLINKLAVSGIKQYNTQAATILFKN